MHNQQQQKDTAGGAAAVKGPGANAQNPPPQRKVEEEGKEGEGSDDEREMFSNNMTVSAFLEQDNDDVLLENLNILPAKRRKLTPAQYEQYKKLELERRRYRVRK